VNWDRKLPRPIVLKDGRNLVTLKDAGELIGSSQGVLKEPR